MTETPLTPDTSIHARRYPDEVKELAYQLWAFIAGENAAETCRLLASDEHGAIVVTYEAVAYWAREYGWAKRKREDVHRIAPDIQYQTFTELLFGGLDGARYIRSVAAGMTEPNKLRLAASIAAVDRVGFSPIGKGTPALPAPQSDTTTQPTDEDVRALSPEELSRRESLYRSSRT